MNSNITDVVVLSYSVRGKQTHLNVSLGLGLRVHVIRNRGDTLNKPVVSTANLTEQERDD